MAPSKKAIAVQTAVMVLTLAGGILIGAKSCSKTNREYMMPPKCKTVEKIIYECPPADIETKGGKSAKENIKIEK